MLRKVYMLSFSNLDYLDQLYKAYKADPQSVEPSWKSFFEGWELASSLKAPSGATPELRVYHLIQAYRTYGHLSALIDPIAVQPPQEAPELSLERYGFKKEELDLPFPTCGFIKEEQAPLKAILEALKKTYCGYVGIEYMGLHTPELEAWMQKKIEPGFPLPFTAEEKIGILDDLNRSEIFEIFLHTKYTGQKRFSLEGGESFIPMLGMILEAACEEGVSEAVLGMAHRGRLNVLANIMNKSYASIFYEFEESYMPEVLEGTGDVKYHRGFTGHLTTKKGKIIHVTLAANASHLESVDPIVEGQARAKQEVSGKKEIIPILVHGDAALSGQGVVYETLQMGKLNGYGTGGTIHIVINNQIGFTTLPKDSRSTHYCTDIALSFGAPVFHVNAEKPEECVYAAKLAFELRQKFHCDVFIDLNCYRKYGHNEGDEPAFTQPVQYKIIRSKSSIRTLYRDSLLSQNILTSKQAEEFETKFKTGLQNALDSIPKQTAPLPISPVKENSPSTSVPSQTLISLTEDFCTVPPGFNLHPKIQKLLNDRLQMVHADPTSPTVDWAMAEHLAFASLIAEGIHVRLSGQDSRRGTFAHRHAVWIDQVSGNRYYPLSHLKTGKAPFDVFNSHLSEFAVVGFEFGYSLSYPKALVIWEAQYGDFANGAQVMFDIYLAASEQRWTTRSGLTLFLPHGYEGGGPEHSSARIERCLQLCGENNMCVANCTTPAQIFHLLRYQAMRTPPKPLIIFTPKGILRHKQCVSPMKEFSEGTFEEILDDPKNPLKPKRLILCSGRVYFDLLEANKRDDITILRLEQLYPFCQEKLLSLISKYKGFQECFWVQEEHSNMGPWEYIRPILEESLKRPIRYVGRGRSAATAAGSHALHQQQQDKLMEEALR